MVKTGSKYFQVIRLKSCNLGVCWGGKITLCGGEKKPKLKDKWSIAFQDLPDHGRSIVYRTIGVNALKKYKDWHETVEGHEWANSRIGFQIIAN